MSYIGMKEKSGGEGGIKPKIGYTPIGKVNINNS